MSMNKDIRKRHCAYHSYSLSHVPLTCSRTIVIVDIAAAFVSCLGMIVILASDNEDFDDVKTGPVVFFTIIVILCCMIGVFGAVMFSQPCVWVALVCHVVGLLGVLVKHNWIGVIVLGFYIYPHAMFLGEMRIGVMSPDNYANEMHSCCCV